jgi:hypothetical protein
LNTIVDNTMSTTLMQGVQDNAAGQITSRTLGTNLIETLGFNPRNQLTGIAAASGATSVLGLTYDYGISNNIGRIRSRTDALQPEHSVIYTYDAWSTVLAILLVVAAAYWYEWLMRDGGWIPQRLPRLRTYWLLFCQNGKDT